MTAPPPARPIRAVTDRIEAEGHEDVASAAETSEDAGPEMSDDKISARRARRKAAMLEARAAARAEAKARKAAQATLETDDQTEDQMAPQTAASGPELVAESAEASLEPATEPATGAAAEPVTDPSAEPEEDAPGVGNRKVAQLEARRAAVAAARAEAQAALQARQEARALAQSQRNERQLAKVEVEAAREEAIRNAAPPVRLARPKRRHYGIITSFAFLVLLPVALMGWYLWERATDQYASNVGFSVRTEEQGSSIESLFGVSDISGSSSTDTDILYEFLQGQQLVALVDAQLDLREKWSRPGVEADPLFSYDAPGTIEDLVEHWGKKVKIYYESNSGLIDLRVLAFDPAEAQQIAQAIYDESSEMINQLSAIAREDAISYAREELEQAQEQLRNARLDIQAFRNRTQIVDPTAQTQTQTGIIGALEQELANAQIDLQLLRETARGTDPRIAQTELRITAINRQITDERAELGIEGENSDTSVADLVGQYETLAVDLQFAEEAYTAARANFDAARNEARRKSRYLAAHVPPTLAEKSEFPERESTLGLVALFLCMAWAFLVLAVYALRDRR